ncbi:PDT-domain-containing protein [Coniochaeta ligniaria NRRL 30616]|uniref:prephenate dehydratase n=1 Tax=Coniochaeta ligniaria NRRL 30616 TaxID=1408157 RepID=A0A1J7J054_9PEZI|nr:PDT-domain-containing protein [Coniochaeta ligniaria NRRL 30616]
MASSEQGPVRPKVAFLGPHSSYSHQATKSVFSENDWELSPTVTIKEIFDVVQSGDAKAGVVPFENSTHGTVNFTLDALADRQGIYNSLIVTGEIYLDVHHFLLGRRKEPGDAEKPEAAEAETVEPETAEPEAAEPETAEPETTPSNTKSQPLTSLSHITRIYSHPQAFGQTSAFVSAHLPGIETVETSSTSRAAQLAAADPTGASAAIAGEIAAATTGLDVLAADIQDRDDNTTRFLVIFREDGDADVLPHDLYVPYAARKGDLTLEELTGLQRSMFKSLLRFTVPHDTPGALADVLDCFRTAELNLTSINSLPSLERPFRYLFFVEFEGDRPGRTDGSGDAVRAAYEGIAKAAKSWKKLGTWMKQRD